MFVDQIPEIGMMRVCALFSLDFVILFSGQHLDGTVNDDFSIRLHFSRTTFMLSFFPFCRLLFFVRSFVLGLLLFYVSLTRSSEAREIQRWQNTK